jgi:hypothetical protein
MHAQESIIQWIRIFGTAVAELVCHACSTPILSSASFPYQSKYSMLVSGTGQPSVEVQRASQL